jgi:uncharacterized membrane protein
VDEKAHKDALQAHVLFFSPVTAPIPASPTLGGSAATSPKTPQKSPHPPTRSEEAAAAAAALLNSSTMASAVSLLLLSPPTPRQLHRAGPPSHLLCSPHRGALLPHAAATTPRPRLLLAAPPRASNNNDAVEAPDRLVAAVAYLYPFLDGAHHGRFLLARFPFFSALLGPLAPAARLFHSSPLTPFLLFLTLYFAVVRNQQAFSRFVRFNAMQAVALDVLLIFPDLLAQSFAPSSASGVGFDIFQSMENTVFLFLFVCLLYGGGACLLGKTPRLPIVADAAERQVM